MQVTLYRQTIATKDDYPSGELVLEKRLRWVEQLGCELNHIEFGTIPVQGKSDRAFIIYVESANVDDTPGNRKILERVGLVSDKDELRMRATK